METERQLLEAIRNGDKTATRRLYDRFSGYTMAIARRYIPEREDVRDVMQDSFVSILTSLNQFSYRGEGSLKSWVARIVVNKALDWVKEREQQMFTSEMPLEAEEEELPDMEGVPPDILNAMIGRLPAGCRLVLNLYVFDQLSHKEIAHRLGIKEGTSASQLFHAKQLLAVMIKKYLDSQRI